MTESKQKDAKQRIFDAAISLFARKSYTGVGIREIAKAADVQVSMVNYYFDGKIGVLKAIMDECYVKYGKAINDVGDENTPLEDRVYMMIHNLITFYRKNAELANAAFGAIPVDIPEIIDYRIKWFESTREAANNWFKLLGFDPENAVQMCVLRDFLDKVIGGFFRARYCCDRIAQESKTSDYVKEHFKHDDHAVLLDDAFFNRYAKTLTKIYLYGITNINKKLKNKGV
ncbi:MAG: TetR family transcriptional regulator [bacterium]